ncbi:pirin family protein [Occallatibacter riparius]|uniref:Pirin family protein n=1 Tax=Occallatibacter riparius TaxID=1002689 RepID=A0A9J7BRJ4_9BACT|nr:pirin family protein [Occallatibacter riparius]UWZ85201.1 pirin family protein [Occallatibacter riparius]
MLTFRKCNERGHAQHGWLDSYHTFSFADYYDPAHMGFRSLRVINEDRVAPGRGFGAHAHRDMEIISYVLSGSLAHKDSMGHQEMLGPNEVQRMSAGTGVVHSEFNGSETEPVHFLQIWIQPASTGTPSSYEQFKFDPAEKQGRLRLIASPIGGDGVARINQDAKIYVSVVEEGRELAYTLERERHAWLQVISGGVTVNGAELKTGDAVAASDEDELVIIGNDDMSEIMLFDLA